MSDTLTFDTTDSDEAVSFWYEFKPVSYTHLTLPTSDLV